MKYMITYTNSDGTWATKQVDTDNMNYDNIMEIYSKPQVKESTIEGGGFRRDKIISITSICKEPKTKFGHHHQDHLADNILRLLMRYGINRTVTHDDIIINVEWPINCSDCSKQKLSELYYRGYIRCYVRGYFECNHTYEIPVTYYAITCAGLDYIKNKSNTNSPVDQIPPSFIMKIARLLFKGFK